MECHAGPLSLHSAAIHATALGGMCSFLLKVFRVLSKIKNLQEKEKGRDCGEEAAHFLTRKCNTSLSGEGSYPGEDGSARFRTENTEE